MTDTCMFPANNGSGNYFIGRPDGWQAMEDNIFVASLLQAHEIIYVISGGNAYHYDAPAGASAEQIPMSVGPQSFAISRNGTTIQSKTSLKAIIDGCVCGLYNFNAYGEDNLENPQTCTDVFVVGSLPPGFNDPLQPDGLSAFRQGLRVSNCEPTPSLGTIPPTNSSSNPPSTPSCSQFPTGVSTITVTNAITIVVTTAITTTQTSTVTQTVPPSSTNPGGGDGGGGGNNACIGGTGPGNYAGLCNFCCHYGCCPPGPCTCTQIGKPVPTPPATGVHGVPLLGEDDSYLGLCSFALNHGYCPPTTCRVV